MKLHRLALTNYRGIAHRDVEFPDHGVVVVCGANEIGKSSMVEALDLLLEYKDRSTKKEVKQVKPTNADVGSEVIAEISSGPYRFVYRKRFHKRCETELTVLAPRREQLTGDEAHERVRTMLAETVDTELWHAQRVLQAASTAAVHPAAVTANRVLLGALVATNILGQNTPAIAATEFDYVEMWAQDVGAMVGYHAGAAAVAETLTPFSVPPLDLAGLASQAGAQLTGMATSVSAALSPIAEGAVEGVPAVVAAAQSVAAGLPVDAALQVGQAAAYPASMLIGPMMQLAQMGTTANTAGLAGAEAAGLAAADVPTFAGDIASGTGLGGAGGLGAGMSAELGKARLVGAMSVPPTWEGSVPARMASSAMAGLGAMPAEVPAAGGPMGMMPMPMGMGGAGAGMPAGMMGRGGANPHVVQARPSVVPRVGIG